MQNMELHLIKKHNKNIKLSQWRHTFIKKFTFIILFSRKINLFNNTLRDLCFFLKKFLYQIKLFKRVIEISSFFQTRHLNIREIDNLY